MANKKEQGFNDAELQEIMSEIENLEREYDEDKPAAETETVEAAPTAEHHEEEHAPTLVWISKLLLLLLLL